LRQSVRFLRKKKLSVVTTMAAKQRLPKVAKEDKASSFATFGT
jgi:hypothetical protein